MPRGTRDNKRKTANAASNAKNTSKAKKSKLDDVAMEETVAKQQTLSSETGSKVTTRSKNNRYERKYMHYSNCDNNNAQVCHIGKNENKFKNSKSNLPSHASLRKNSDQKSISQQEAIGACNSVDGVQVMVDTTEYDDEGEDTATDGQTSDSESEYETQSEEDVAEGEVLNDFQSDYQDNVSQFSHEIDNEISFKIGETEQQPMEDMINQMVQKSVSAEREVLREEFKKLEEMREKIRKESAELEKSKGKNGKEIPRSPVIKSPSDTTVYAPAVLKSPNKDVEENDKSIADKISDFINQIRFDTDISGKGSHGGDSPMSKSVVNKRGKTVSDDVQPSTSGYAGKGKDDAKTLANKLIIEAEQFKAAIEQPSGGSTITSTSDIVNDDHFFHLSCHVDDNLRGKIERGEYVDLEKLLNASGFNKFRKPLNNQGSEMRFWQRDGETFLAPVDNKKINGLKKWDQAFRTYATIYSGANPSRAQEIWQYVEVIHTAAASFSWDNVASYDHMFRQLMEFNPKRSWGVTYVHMWTLTMTDPINKFVAKTNTSGNEWQKAKLKVSEEGENVRYNYCWSFNRGNCKYGDKCRYDNRCKYCNSTKHGINVCNKAKNNNANTTVNAKPNK